MKYIIDIPDNTHWIQWIMEGTKDHHPYMDWINVEDLRFYTESDRKAIEDEVWRLADNIHGMSIQDKMSCFGFALTSAVTLNLSYQEAKDKYEAWKRVKDGKPRFCDEVEDDSGIKAVVMDITPEGEIIVFTENGCVERWGKYHKSKKTGRYFSEVIGMLQKMSGEEQ